MVDCGVNNSLNLLFSFYWLTIKNWVECYCKAIENSYLENTGYYYYLSCLLGNTTNNSNWCRRSGSWSFWLRLWLPVISYKASPNSTWEDHHASCWSHRWRVAFQGCNDLCYSSLGQANLNHFREVCLFGNCIFSLNKVKDQT